LLDFGIAFSLFGLPLLAVAYGFISHYIDSKKYPKVEQKQTTVSNDNLYLKQEPYNRYDGGDYNHAETL